MSKTTNEQFEQELLKGRCLIPLGKGYFTEVDEHNFEWLLNLCSWSRLTSKIQKIYMLMEQLKTNLLKCIK